MRACRWSLDGEPPRVGVLADDDTITPLSPGTGLFDALRALRDGTPLAAEGPPVPLAAVRLHAPVERQEVWGAGVTYARSRSARVAEAEHDDAAAVYARVYEAARPELFLKAAPGRSVGCDDEVALRPDSQWTVPEPELALWLDADLRLLGLGLANDMSARDIEGENPLYLPQAKIWDAACSLGPWVRASGRWDDAADVQLRLEIARSGATLFAGEVSTAQIVRPFADLAAYLGRACSFPDGVVLMTGTGIVPPDEVALAAGDVIEISAPGLGTIRNRVRAGAGAERPAEPA